MISMSKAWNAGILIKKQYPTMSWVGITLMDEFEKSIETNQLDENNLLCMRDGFEGYPYKDHSLPKPKEPSGLMPFGVHKGKSFDSVPVGYFFWLLKQDWITKWPMIMAYAKYKVDDDNKNSLPPDELNKLMEEIIQTLK